MAELVARCNKTYQDGQNGAGNQGQSPQEQPSPSPSAKKRYLSGTATDQPAEADELETKHVLVFLAQGFDDAEAATIIDILGWTQYRPSIATVEVVLTGTRAVVEGAFGTAYKTQVTAKDVNAENFDALVVPGGFHNLGYDEAYCDEVRALAIAMRAEGKPIATMCVGALAVAESGVLEGGRATTFSFSSRHDNRGRLRELGCEPVNEPVVDWNGIISCSGPAHSEAVAMLLLEHVAGPAAAAEVARYRKGC